MPWEWRCCPPSGTHCDTGVPVVKLISEAACDRGYHSFEVVACVRLAEYLSRGRHHAKRTPAVNVDAVQQE